MRNVKLALAKIKFLEPLMLRGAGEFDPSSRGVYSYASTLHLPRPSTLVGALISSFHPQSGVSVGASFRDILISSYAKALDDLGIEAIRGFHVYSGRDDKYYVPLILGRRRPALINYHEILRNLNMELLDSLLGCLAGGECKRDILERLRDIDSLLARETLTPKIQERVGIALKTRLAEVSSKTVREGYIYTAEYVTYADPTMEVRFSLLLRSSNMKESLIPEGGDLALKLGGEQRIVKLRVEREPDKMMEKLAKLAEEEHKYLLLTTPTPINHEDLEKLKLEYIGRLDIVGLGYSIALRKRKPLYIALLEGTIVKVNRGKIGLDALKYGLYAVLGLHNVDEYRVLGRMGYGTFYPLT